MSIYSSDRVKPLSPQCAQGFIMSDSGLTPMRLRVNSTSPNCDIGATVHFALSLFNERSSSCTSDLL